MRNGCIDEEKVREEGGEGLMGVCNEAGRVRREGEEEENRGRGSWGGGDEARRVGGKGGGGREDGGRG